RIRCAVEDVEIPLQELPSVPEMETLVEQRTKALGEGVSPERIESDHLVAYARDVIAERQRPEEKRSRMIEMQAIALGDAALVTTPGETFFEIGEAIRSGSPFAHTLVTGYTNGVIGYLPTAKAFEEGGYEPETSFRFYYGTYILAPGAERAVVDAGIRLAKHVWQD
ncbi:MAG: hypothetical protein QGI83_15455, partial [Candidatus Latescibacteria bacterium]|nr:hypothetical protein [Candidatus Latescibacterota bacterium]